LAELN